MPDSTIRPEKCRKTADMLNDAFVWEQTPEGHEYWSKVCRKLRRMANDSESARKEVLANVDGTPVD